MIEPKENNEMIKEKEIEYKAPENGEILVVDPLVEPMVFSYDEVAPEATLEKLFNTVEQINHMKRPHKPISKAPFDMIPPIAILEEAKAFGYSDARSARDYWEQEVVKFSEIYAEMQRHLLSWYNGEDIDPASGCPHIAHLRKCTAKILYLASKGRYIDDRFNIT